MKTFNPKMQRIQISPIVRISEEAREKRADFEKKEGKPFVLFQRGEIDFPTPDRIRDAIKRALDSGKTKYPKAGGENEPKMKIVEKLEVLNGIKNLAPENLVLTYGGQEALELSFQLFEGKKACGFSPIWSVLLENFIPYSGISFKEVPLNADFSVNLANLEEALKQADVFYFNNPHNPTGKVFTKEELAEIGGLCKKYGTFIISDEAYEHIVFDGKKHVSLASLPGLEHYEDIISAFTFSKTFAMTGLRLGYAASRNRTAVDLMKKGDYTQTAGVTTAVQEAATVAFSPEVMKEVAERTALLERRRDDLFRKFREIEGVRVEKPEGAFYFYPDFAKFIPQTLKAEERDWHIYKLCMSNGIAIVPGCCFSKEGHFLSHARFSFSMTSLEMIEEGLSRLKAILA